MAKYPKLVILVIVLLVAFFILLSALLLENNSDKLKEAMTQTSNIDDGAEDWDGNLQQNAQHKGNPNADSIAIPGYPEVRILSDSKTADIILGNPEGNPCYFTYELVLIDKDGNDLESLYTSKQIAPGKAVKKIELSRPLEKGEYDAIFKITTNHLETQARMNGANVKTKLIVE